MLSLLVRGIILILFVAAMLLIERIEREGSKIEGESFTAKDIRRRRFIAILFGIAIFFGLWFYVAIRHKDPLSSFGV